MSQLDEKVIAKVDRENDLEVHARVLKVDGDDFIDLREYIPSKEAYGRGITMPINVFSLLSVQLFEVLEA